MPKQILNELTARKKLTAALALGLLIAAIPPCVSAAGSDVFLRLQASRDALLGQERDLRNSYDDVTRQIDDLRKKQALLDSYLTQTRSAIRGVERAMETAQ
ncbi:MAG TPA: hypothetical protein V6C76_12815 [Drouetiella sp.]